MWRRLRVLLSQNENPSLALVAGTLEALSIAAFICDRSGLVRTLTPSAKALISEGRALRMKQGRLRATRPADTQTLNEAIEVAAEQSGRAGHSPGRTVICDAEKGRPPLVLDVVSLSSRHSDAAFSPRALVVVRGARNANPQKASVLQVVYRLTAAETEVALLLAEGRSPQDIAAMRDVSVGTVRVQIKALLAKTGAHRQVELVSRLARL
jgi:DNA-binding CsgD family transcriptional regulator